MWRLTSSRGRALGRQNLSRVSASALANAAWPDPPPAELCSDGDLVGGSQTIAADDAELVVPSLCGGRGGADGCHAVFTWIEAQRWTDVLRARLTSVVTASSRGTCFSSSSLPGRRAPARQELSSAARSFAPGQSRLASGLVTMMFTLTLGSDGGRAGRVRAPKLACVRAPAHMLVAQHTAADGDAWLATAHSDFQWMAEEFNRQYIVSRGKPHPEYAPLAADDLLQLHYFNGRLWCFMGAVSNATRSLEEASKINPHHVYSHLLLAKIRIGQGLHEKALNPLDEAARIQPSHWQTHLMRLHCMRALGSGTRAHLTSFRGASHAIMAAAPSAAFSAGGRCLRTRPPPCARSFRTSRAAAATVAGTDRDGASRRSPEDEPAGSGQYVIPARIVHHHVA